MSPIRNFVTRSVLLTALLAVAFSLPACASIQQNQRLNPQTITIGMDSTAVNALILVADSQNFFSKNGLSVSIKNYPSGLAAVEAMQKDEVNVAVASEFVLVGKAFANAPLRTWGSIDKFMHNYLIARKDHGIQTVADLQGRKIGLPLKTAAEFYLGRFLELHQMKLGEVTLVNINPGDLAQALTSGQVDAVVAWQLNAKIIEDRLGPNAIYWPAQNDQVAYAVLLSTEQWTKQHPQNVDRFLKALVEAETFYAGHPQEVRGLLQEKLSYDDASMTTIWPEHQFQVSLDQSLILAMEDESRWMIYNHMVQAQQPPVFLNFIYMDGMLSARPDAVNIIH